MPGTPLEARRWRAGRGGAVLQPGLQEMCAAQRRALREQVRALLASHVDGRPAPTSALQAVNDAMTRVPTIPLLRWDQAHGLHRGDLWPSPGRHHRV
ncbi:ABATE domain-containing protein [Aquipuribacter hungaricus]|uniref:ABATE domain-containing protein n=1 Tax=Aquipuribacter hungaricus TaxID=545624 RepID=UPI00362093B7